jgi:ABC-type Zn uptake system ZnuABC Zn-binding protein ZnuA
MNLKSLLWPSLLISSLLNLAQAAPLQVVASNPDLGSLVQAVGGDKISLTVLAKGTEDPHYIEAKPSFIKALNQADLYIQIGLEMEVGYAPLLLNNAQNPKILPNETGHLDISGYISPREVPTEVVDRSMGDVHPFGNPHYLLDPLNGLSAAAAIRERLSSLRPSEAEYFNQHYQEFAKKIANSLLGEKLAAVYKPEDLPKLALLFERGQLGKFLESQGQQALLAGWFGMMLPFYGTLAVDDHDLWIYFTARFGIKVIEHLEPKPGIAPTTKHLGEVVEKMRTEKVKLILTTPYYDPSHARFVAEQTGAKIAKMAHQVESLPPVTDYFKLVDHNVQRVVAVLSVR